jgi:stringent starvation protein B
MQETSTKPYLLRALYEWCTDNGFTPHIVVKADTSTRVPREFVRDGEIVLNISFAATSQLKMGNEWVEFSARFSGRSHKIEVPVANVLAIYASENGQGMAFPLEEASGGETAGALGQSAEWVEEEGEPESAPSDTAGATGAAASPADSGSNNSGNGGGSGNDDGAKGGKGHLKVVK